MALSATIYRLKVALSDVDRSVYESLDLRLARHPSESARYLFARTIAYCLLYEEGIAFSKGGLSDADEPALSIRDLQGNLRAWIEIGTPTADRLHKASKASPRLVVFTHNDPALLLRAAQERAIHKADQIEVFSLAPAFLDTLDASTDRNAAWELTHTDGQLYVVIDGKTYEGAVTRHTLAGA